MNTNMKELNQEQMMTVGGAGLLDVIGHTVKSVTHKDGTGTNKAVVCTRQESAARKNASGSVKPASESPVLGIIGSITKGFFRFF